MESVGAKKKERKTSLSHTDTNENTNGGDTFFDKAHGNANTFVQWTRDDWLRKNGFQKIEQKNGGKKLFVYIYFLMPTYYAK